MSVSHDFSERPPGNVSAIFIDTLFLETVNPADYPGLRVLIVHHLASMEAIDPITKIHLQKKESRQLAAFDACLATSDFTRHYLQKELNLTLPVLVVPPGPGLVCRRS